MTYRVQFFGAGELLGGTGWTDLPTASAAARDQAAMPVGADMAIIEQVDDAGGISTVSSFPVSGPQSPEVMALIDTINQQLADQQAALADVVAPLNEAITTSLAGQTKQLAGLTGTATRTINQALDAQQAALEEVTGLVDATLVDALAQDAQPANGSTAGASASVPVCDPGKYQLLLDASYTLPNVSALAASNWPSPAAALTDIQAASRADGYTGAWLGSGSFVNHVFTGGDTGGSVYIGQISACPAQSGFSSGQASPPAPPVPLKDVCPSPASIVDNAVYSGGPYEPGVTRYILAFMDQGGGIISTIGHYADLATALGDLRTPDASGYAKSVRVYGVNPDGSDYDACDYSIADLGPRQATTATGAPSQAEALATGVSEAVVSGSVATGIPAAPEGVPQAPAIVTAPALTDPNDIAACAGKIQAAMSTMACEFAAVKALGPLAGVPEIDEPKTYLDAVNDLEAVGFVADDYSAPPEPREVARARVILSAANSTSEQRQAALAVINDWHNSITAAQENVELLLNRLIIPLTAGAPACPASIEYGGCIYNLAGTALTGRRP